MIASMAYVIVMVDTHLIPVEHEDRNVVREISTASEGVIYMYMLTSSCIGGIL